MRCCLMRWVSQQLFRKALSGEQLQIIPVWRKINILGNRLNNKLFVDFRYRKKVNRKWKQSQAINKEEKKRNRQNKISRNTKQYKN